MAILFDKENKIITIEAPAVEITIQNLLNAIREYEDELSSMDIPVIASAAGKEDLGGGVSVGITLTLLDDWQLAFEARGGADYIQCRVSGGNLVAVNVNGAIYPTAFTQVLITASSSATLQELDAIQYASFNGGVSVDVSSSYNGTTFPTGTPQEPVNNLTDAHLISINRGLTKIYVINDLPLDTTIDFSEHIFQGNSHVNNSVFDR